MTFVQLTLAKCMLIRIQSCWLTAEKQGQKSLI